MESLDRQELSVVAAFTENEPKKPVYLTAVLSVSGDICISSVSTCNGGKDIKCFFLSE